MSKRGIKKKNVTRLAVTELDNKRSANEQQQNLSKLFNRGSSKSQYIVRFRLILITSFKCAPIDPLIPLNWRWFPSV